MYLKDKKVLILSDYDSRVKWGLSLLRSICAGIKSFPKVTVLYRSCPKTIFMHYHLDGDFIQYNNFGNEELKLKIKESDLVILGLGGADNLKIINFIHSLGNSRPLMIAGFNGLVDRTDPNPLLCRIGADIICVNNQLDMISYMHILKGLNIPSSSLILTGYQRYYLESGIQKESLKLRDIWLFIEQIGVPDTNRRINYLIRKLILIAKNNPDIDLIIHCRHVPGYKTVRNERETSFRKVWRTYKKEISGLKNIKLVGGLLENWLMKADFCFSFNSTVLLEALYLNKKIGVLSDFGISHKIGNHVFVGAKIFVTLDELSEKKIPSISMQWKKENCLFNETLELRERLYAVFLLKILPNISPYYTVEKAPFFFESKRLGKNLFKALWEILKK